MSNPGSDWADRERGRAGDASASASASVHIAGGLVGLLNPLRWLPAGRATAATRPATVSVRDRAGQVGKCDSRTHSHLGRECELQLNGATARGERPM